MYLSRSCLLRKCPADYRGHIRVYTCKAVRCVLCTAACVASRDPYLPGDFSARFTCTLPGVHDYVISRLRQNVTLSLSPSPFPPYRSRLHAFTRAHLHAALLARSKSERSLAASRPSARLSVARFSVRKFHAPMGIEAWPLDCVHYVKWRSWGNILWIFMRYISMQRYYAIFPYIFLRFSGDTLVIYGVLSAIGLITILCRSYRWTFVSRLHYTFPCHFNLISYITPTLPFPARLGALMRVRVIVIYVV